MASLADIRGAIKTRLLTIAGLRAEDLVAGPINPPLAVVGFPERIDYDRSMGRGTDETVIPIRIYVAQGVTRAANDLLEGYLNKTGATSVKAAIEGDRTLGATVADCRMRAMTGAGVVEVANVQYLYAEWELVYLA